MLKNHHDRFMTEAVSVLEVLLGAGLGAGPGEVGMSDSDPPSPGGV